MPEVRPPSPSPSPPSLLNLSVQQAIDNVKHIGNVGNVDFHLLERILPHCNLEQLKHIEDCTEGRDLSPVTNQLWKKFFERRFGESSLNLESKLMNLTWRELYEAKIRAMEDKLQRSSERVRELYEEKEEEKQKKRIKVCNKVPPSKAKRGGGSYGGGISISNSKTTSSIMKKAKTEYLVSMKCKRFSMN